MLESAWRCHVASALGVGERGRRRRTRRRGVGGGHDERRCRGHHGAARPRRAERNPRRRRQGPQAGREPAKGIENLPRKTAKRRVYLSAQDVERLADASGEHRALVLLLAYAGLRWGEAVALRVSDVEFLRRRLAVHANAVQTRGVPRGRPDQGARRPLGAGAAVRARGAVGAVRRQGRRGSGVLHSRRRLPTAPEVGAGLFRRRGENRPGSSRSRRTTYATPVHRWRSRRA